MGKAGSLSRRQLLLAGGAGSILAMDSKAAQAPAVGPLYLHWWRPRCYVKDERTGTDSTPPKRILSTRIVPGQDLSITLGDRYAVLTGRIIVGGKRCHAKLQGQYGSCISFVDAEIEVEKPFEGGYLCASSITWETRFAISTDEDCKRFLKDAEPVKQR